MYKIKNGPKTECILAFDRNFRKSGLQRKSISAQVSMIGDATHHPITFKVINS